MSSTKWHGALSSRSRNISALLAIFVLAFVPVFEVRSLLPAIMQDEYLYSFYSRLASPVDSGYVNFAFFKTYELTNLCGENFYQCAKVMNGFFLAIGGLALYVITLSFGVRWWISVCAGIAYVLGPLSLATAYFMPEAMYFALSIISFLLLSLVIRSERMAWSILSSLICVLSVLVLTKPHAWVTVLAYGLIIFASLRWGRKVKGWRPFVLGSLIVFATLGLRHILVFAMYGVFESTLIGANYARSLLEMIVRVQELPSALSASGPGALLAAGGTQGESFISLLTLIGMTFALGIIATGVLAVLPLTPFDLNLRLQGFALFSTLVCLAMLVTLFQVGITLQGDDHTERLLFRHLEWIFPVLVSFIIAISERVTLNRRWWLSLAAVCLALWSAYFVGARVAPSQADSSFVYAFNDFQPMIFMLILLVGALAVVPKLPLRASADALTRSSIAVAVLGLLVISGQSSSLQRMSYGTMPIASDLAGQKAKDIASSGDSIVTFTVVGANTQAATVAAFWIDDSETQVVVGGLQDVSRLLGSQETDYVVWLSPELDGLPAPYFVGEGFTIFSSGGK